MRSEEEVRKSVSEAYKRAVSKPKQVDSAERPIPAGAVAKLAGYTDEELSQLPPEAVVNSFGCGNPVAFSELRRGDVVVDLGSGAGIDILLAARKVGPEGRAIGIDMTDEMIAKAKANIEASGLRNAEVRKGIIEDLPIESASVDWVISNCVVNLSPQKPKVFSEIVRVLRPGGRMIISDIVVNDIPEWIKENEKLYNSCVAGAISEAEYLEGLRQAGLSDVEVQDRLVYDLSQIKAFIRSELPDLESNLGSCGFSLDKEAITRIAESVTGKVWSAKFYARKPG